MSEAFPDNTIEVVLEQLMAEYATFSGNSFTDFAQRIPDLRSSAEVADAVQRNLDSFQYGFGTDRDSLGIILKGLVIKSSEFAHETEGLSFIAKTIANRGLREMEDSFIAMRLEQALTDALLNRPLFIDDNTCIEPPGSEMVVKAIEAYDKAGLISPAFWVNTGLVLGVH